MRVWQCCAIFLAMMLFGNTATAVTYYYTGPLYTTASGAYTTSMRIQGSFTISGPPLPANMAFQQIGPGGIGRVTSWSFTDGVNTYTNADSMLLYGDPYNFSVSTDASGAIDYYVIGLMSPPGMQTVGQLMNGVRIDRAEGAAASQLCASVVANVCVSIGPGGSNHADNLDAGGTWALGAPPTPTPAGAPALTKSMLLVLSLLVLALGYRSYRLRRS